MMVMMFSFFVNNRFRNWWLSYNFLLLILNYKSSSCFSLLTYNFRLISNLCLSLLYLANSSSIPRFPFLYYFWANSFSNFYWLSKSCLSIIIFLNSLTLSSLIWHYLCSYVAFSSLSTLVLFTLTYSVATARCVWLLITSWIC